MAVCNITAFSSALRIDRSPQTIPDWECGYVHALVQYMHVGGVGPRPFQLTLDLVLLPFWVTASRDGSPY